MKISGVHGFHTNHEMKPNKIQAFYELPENYDKIYSNQIQ
jgi:hypothetical protein